MLRLYGSPARYLVGGGVDVVGPSDVRVRPVDRELFFPFVAAIKVRPRALCMCIVMSVPMCQPCPRLDLQGG